MKRRTIWTVVMVALVAVGCGPKGSTANGPATTPEMLEPPSRELVTMLLMRQAAGLERGDTVTVDLAEVSDDLRVRRAGTTGSAGWVPLQALGPIGTDTMVVVADRPNVRRCRSRGCSVLGYVTWGELVQVHDFVGGWFRFTGSDGTKGYIHSDHVETRTYFRRKLLEDTRQRMAAYFKRELAPRSASGGGNLFSGHAVTLEDGMLGLAFYAPHAADEDLAAICDAMRGIADFVESRMSRVPPGILAARSLGIYAGAADGERGEMLAGPSGDGGVYCKGPGQSR